MPPRGDSQGLTIWYRVNGRCQTRLKDFTGGYLDDLKQEIKKNEQLEEPASMLELFVAGPYSVEVNLETLGNLKDDDGVFDFEKLNKDYRIKEPNPILVKLPAPSPTGGAPSEIRAELDCLCECHKRLQESSVTLELLAGQKTGFAVFWTVNLHTITMNQLKAKLWDENDSIATFLFKQGDKIYVPETDEELRDCLRILFFTNQRRIKVSVTTPSKDSSSYTLREVWTLYGLRLANGQRPR